MVVQMVFADLLSVPDAARRLGVHPSRVRALLAAGELQGSKLGGHWIVEADSVRRRLDRPRAPGRALEPANAWAALFLASGLAAGGTVAALSPDTRWRIRKLLDEQGLDRLAPRLRQRARRERYRAHPGVFRHLAQRPGVVLTGVSAAAAAELDLVSGEEMDAYVTAEARDALVAAYAMEPAGVGGNVSLRVVAEGCWPFAEELAPLAVIALDLAEDADSRGARVGRQALEALDRERRWRRRAERSARARWLV